MTASQIQLIARTLSECDGKSWETLTDPQRERYARIAAFVAFRLAEREAKADEAMASLQRESKPISARPLI